MFASTTDFGKSKPLNDRVAELEIILGDFAHEIVRRLITMDKPQLVGFVNALSAISKHLSGSKDRAAHSNEEEHDAHTEDLLTPGEIDKILEKLEEEIEGIQLTAESDSKGLHAF